MHRMRTLAVGLTVAISLGSGAAALAPAALASVARPASVGTFHSWRAAQRAAGFGLIRPGNTYGLRRNGLVIRERTWERRLAALPVGESSR